MPARGPDEFASFPSTHWTQVVAPAAGPGEAKREALGALLRLYLPAMKAHLVYRKGIDPHRAEDLLQNFVVQKVLDADLVSRAERERGKFRTFLLTSLDRFVLNQFRDENARKRAAPSHSRPVPLEEEIDAVDPSRGPAETFDTAWARQVLDEAVRRMEAHCQAGTRPDVWAVFEGRVLLPALHQAEPVPYERLVERFGFASPAQASNVLVTANRTFVRVLRSVVGQYVEGEAEIDAEIEDLRRILSQSGAGSL